MSNFLFLAANLSLNLFFFCALLDIFLGRWFWWWHLQWIQCWLGASSSSCWEKSMVHERKRWNPKGKVSEKMACMIVKMVGSAMARKPWARHAGAHHHLSTGSWTNLTGISTSVAWLALTCHWMSWFLLPCWSCFLPKSQSSGLCTVHFMWWMHQCHVFLPTCLCFGSFSLGSVFFHSLSFFCNCLFVLFLWFLRLFLWFSTALAPSFFWFGLWHWF